MSELNIVIALAIIYAILWMAKHKVFMYQRTIRKIALKYNIPQNRLGFLYPQRYMTLHWVSGMRWVALGVILFLNWKVALGLLVLGAIVTMVYPEQDDFVNMKMDRDILVRLIVKKTPCKIVYQSMRNQRTDFPVLTCAVSKLNDVYYASIGARPSKAMLICDEQGLLNKDLTVESAKAFASFVAETVPTGSNFRGGTAYRTHLIKALVDRSVTELGGI
jgi:hypothetical protein